MTGGGLGRLAERNAIADFLTTAETGQAGLIIEGEAGIGKTNLWLDAVEQARTRGFRVLAAQVGEAETVLAYAAVGDLLGDIEPAVLDGLPDVQRLALDRVLLRAAGDGLVTDQRVVAAALSSIVDALSPTTPVLVAIDDVQWLDPSSHAVVAFAARRLRGRVGMLLSERCEPDKGTWWSRIGEPDDFSRIRLGPMSLGGLHSIITANLGRSLSRPVMVRIAEISGGNPFYALELARAMGGRPLQPEPGLPATLADLVRQRIGRLDGDVRTCCSLSHPSPPRPLTCWPASTTPPRNESSTCWRVLRRTASSASSATESGSPIRCWPAASTPTRPRRAVGPCTGPSRPSRPNPNSRPATSPWRRPARTTPPSRH